MHQRNTDGLRNHAQAKRRETLRRVEKGIQQLVKEGRPINFKTVAEVSKVSRAWLNKEPDIRQRIQFLRNQQGTKRSVPPSQRASDASNAAKAKTLLQEVKKLRAENQGLRQHIEEILGRILYADEQAEQARRETEAVRAENARLKKQLNQHHSQNLSLQSNKVVNSPQEPTIAPQSKASQIQAAIADLGIKLNSTLRKVIEAASEETVLTALEALKEAMEAGAVKNPAGWFKRAIEDSWQPNANYTQTDGKSSLKVFNEWFPLARSKSLVIASTQNDGDILVLTAKEKWLPFSQALDLYPLESLK
jgi:hypothetical protein